MTIAEFFADIGFDIKGDKQLAEADKNLSRMAVSAVTVLGAVAALNAGLAALVQTTLRTAVGFKDFELQTGLSVDRLRAWQHLAEVNDVSAQSLTDTIKGLQSAQADIKLGRGNIAPWQLLGISPNTDPFTVLELLRKKVQELPPDMARVITGQMGIGDQMFQMLRNANREFDKLDKRLLLTGRERQNLIQLNRAWKDIVFTLSSLKDRIVAQFAEPMRVAVGILKGFLVVATSVLDWMGGTSTLAKITKIALWALVGIFVAGTLAAGAMAAGIGLVSLALKTLLLLLTPITLPFLAFAAVLGIVIFALGGLLLMWNDFWAAVDKRKHIFNWDNEIALVNQLAAGIEKLISLWNRLKGDTAGADFWRDKAAQHEKEAGGTATDQRFAWQASSIKDLLASLRTGNSSVRQENNVEVHVNGAADPHATAASTGSAIHKELLIAAYHIPAPSY